MQKKYSAVLVTFLLLLSILIPTAVWAEGGEQANSPGTPGQKPLSFTGITLTDSGENVENAVDIPLSPKFKLSFDKNVVNSLYWENNSKCLSMITDSKENVPLSVTKIDDTIDFSQRQNIFVEPVKALLPGTGYKLSVSPNFMAKNGVSTLGGTTDGKGVTISFKTAGEAPKPAATTKPEETTKPAADSSGSAKPQSASGQTTTPATPAVQPDKSTPSGAEATDTGTKSTAQGETANPATGQTGTPAGNEAAQPASAQPAAAAAGNPSGFSGLNWIVVIGVVLIIIWIGAEVIVRRKKKNINT